MAITWLENISDEEIFGKNVLCRVDFNVPLNDNNEIADSLRIDLALPTIRRLISANAKVVLLSHLGRPKGKPRASLSLEPVADYLRGQLNQEITFVHECVGDGVAKIVSEQKNGSVTLLENARFHAGEEKNDQVFAKILARGMDFYVDDAFGCVHRAHASVDAVVKFFQKPMGGLLLKQETETLHQLVHTPKKPFVVIIGGAKVSSKIGALTKLLNKVNTLIIGGGMAYTFLAARGENVGASLVEIDKLNVAKSLLKRAAEIGVKILLPVDHVVCTNLTNKTDIATIDANKFSQIQMGVDIGPKTIENYTQALQGAATIFFNGPMGVYEQAEFIHGTNSLITAVANNDAFSVIGGGDSLAAANKLGLLKKFAFVSSGGGASLAMIEGKNLPGLQALGFYDHK